MEANEGKIAPEASHQAGADPTKEGRTMSDSGTRGKPTFHPDTDPSPGVDDGCFEKSWLMVFIFYFASFLFWLVSSDGDPDAILPVAVGLFGFFLLFFIYVFVVRQKNKRLIEQHEQQQLSEDADAALKAGSNKGRPVPSGRSVPGNPECHPDKNGA